MTLYNNLRQGAPIRCVELPPDAEGNAFFFHLDPKADKEAVKAWLTSEGGQEIVSDTKMGDHALIVTRSGKTCDEFLAAAKNHGDDFQVPVVEKKFNAWKWRGITSIVGQTLQLLSSFTTVKTKPGRSGDNWAIGGFAVSNLVANITNITVGSQKKSDPHQLHLLKEEFNKKLAPYLPQGETLPGTEEKRAELREAPKQTGKEKVKAAIRKYSVSGGEIGLRVFGSASLAFPFTQFGDAAKTLKTSGSLKEAFNAAKNNDNPVTYKVGKIMLLGKFVSFLSKEPDPYNPKPPSIIDKIREKATFRASSIIEGIAAGIMMVDRYKKNVKLGSKQYRDWFGVVGNAVFIGGYVVRLFAKYGSLEVNMKELSAHLSDCLAKAPREKLPELVAQTAIDLKHHFKEKAPDLSTLYLDLANDLKFHHNIALPATMSLPALAQEDDAAAKTFASEELKKSQKSAPPAAYQDRIAVSEATPAAGIAS